jgi:hypothetical protein
VSTPSGVQPQPFPQLYFCCDENRRDSIRGTALNGIDYLEVVDHDALAEADRQRFLRIHFVNNIAANSLGKANVSISGGERVRPIIILGATIGTGDDADVLTVEVKEPGDYSIYTLSLVRGPNDPAPPTGIDPRLAWVEFSFKVECPSDFDCAPKHICPPEARLLPEINYLAKDYASFRELILDRMALLLPDWRERSAADLGITLVELLAYAGDYLSYQQDAVATEAYLGTARKRVSLRRHARLVDYFVHDGTNARVWVQLTLATDNITIPARTQILSRLDRFPIQIAPLPNVLSDALRQNPIVFETIHDITLFTKHENIPFYTWSDQQCCLPKGATKATLAGHFPDLQADDVLIFEEHRALLTGATDDADRTRRCAVRLTSVTTFAAGGKSSLTDPLTSDEITEIEWMAEDFLPFPFCISGFTDEEHGSQYFEDLSLAQGNIVLADHGLSVKDELLGQVPQPQILLPPAVCADRCNPVSPKFALPRFRPSPQNKPLTQATDYDVSLPASQSLVVDPAKSRPVISLHSKLKTAEADWDAQLDLLGCAADATDFVVEIENDQTAFIRFGDDEHGRRPDSGTTFTATYRVGNGTSGNVGAETLTHIVTTVAGITGVRNPLPATGGVDPETMDEIRRDAPQAFRTQMRAVTEDDYARKAELDNAIQRAAATFRWTGSWHTVFITVDPFNGLPLTNDFEARLASEIEQYRMAGHDLEIDSPHYVSLEIDMFVCVKPNYFRSDVSAALLELFSSGVLPDGRKGVFHPAFFTFGQTVYLSPLYAAAQAVAGVASVQITTFQRQDLPETSGLADGFLKMNRLEIARLDNDPDFVEHGIFKLTLGGGR